MDLDVDAAPDAALPLAAALAFADGASRLTGVARLREKESDRLLAVVDLLTRAGASARVESDEAGAPALSITGRGCIPRAAAFVAHGDHRVAMSAAILALVLPEATLDDPGCVAKSWPGFWEVWTPLVG
jgi:3-phosphoshikimate 1-carboxyvinyltransferase